MTEVDLRLADGRVAVFQPVQSTDPRVQAFERGHPGQQWCLGSRNGGDPSCLHCGEARQPGPAVLATLGQGDIIAAARITFCGETPGQGHLSVTVASRYEDSSSLATELLRQIGELARGEGYDRLVACFAYRHHDAMRDCVRAGLRVESALGHGSITEVVIRLD